MPNHVKNIICIYGDSEQIKRILQEIQNDEIGIGSLDFNKLIPMPQSLNIESGSRTQEGLQLYHSFLDENNIPEEISDEGLQALITQYVKQTEVDPEVFMLGKQTYENIVHYGYPTWYEWSNANWGTKWNAYEFIPYDVGNSISFLTAWNGVPQILAVLSEKYPDISFGYSWADENIGYNVGMETYLNGNAIDSYMPIGDSKEAYEYAEKIWNFGLTANYGLSEDGMTNIARSDDEEDSLEV